MEWGTGRPYVSRVRLVADAAAVAVAVSFVVESALLPEFRATLIGVAAALAMLVVMWGHLVPPAAFGRLRISVEAVALQLIGVWLLFGTGGMSSPFFTYYTLPTLISVFGARLRDTVVVGAVAFVGCAIVVVTATEVGDAEGAARTSARLVVLVGLVLFSVVASDILGRSRRALAAGRARESELIRSLADPILLVDGTGHVLHCNPATVELFGRELSGASVADILPLADAGTDRAVHATIRDARGAERAVEVRRRALPGTDEAVWSVHDVSDLIELTRLREDLLYAVAHELRNPLGVLRNVLDIVRDEYAEMSAEQFDDLIASGQRTARRLHQLMENLLSAGSIQSGRFVVNPRPMPLRELVDPAVEDVSDLIVQRHQWLDLDVPADLWVSADARYASGILTNLLLNAARYTAEAGHLGMRARAADPVVRIEVWDRGAGIPEDDQRHLFERFYRARQTAQQHGIGLGLAIARGVVEAHGGTIGLDSKPGIGTTVWFTLPMAAPA